MGLGERSREGYSIWLAYCGSWADTGPKHTHAGMGALFIPKWALVMMFAVTSHCTCHLPKVWPDTFYVTSWIMAVGIKRCATGP